jgi:signal peptidase I
MDDPRTPPPPTAAAAEESLKPVAPPAEAPISTGKGVKETVESILIAFILAFVFRAFVVEAFVIPTGSMATTLLGAHMRFTCKECGYQFDVNFPSMSRSGEEVDIPSFAGPVDGHDRSFAIFCPNCRYKVSLAEATNPPVRYGDRILVLKYLYIPWISSPRRWDVVVFKTPTRPPADTPWYTINYIKRLVGLPGEHLMVLDGDVYVRKSDTEPWTIQTKPKYAQDAMWRIVYDHDFRPLNKDRNDGWTLPWVHNDSDGWDTGDKEHSRVFRFKSATGGGRLKFDPTTVPHYNPAYAPGGYFTDWLAYDVSMTQFDTSSFNSMPDYPVYTVSDLKLAFFYQRHSGEGPLRARMTKHDHEFALEFDPNAVKLKHRRPDGSEVEIPAVAPFDPSKVSGPIRVDFENVDYRVIVRLNEKVVFETTPEQYKPDVEELLERFGGMNRTLFPPPAVSLDAARQDAEFSHVSLWRDVYYTPEEAGRSPLRHGSPSHPVELKADEFFVMGDNSAASSDARYWTESVHLPDEQLDAESGRVPGRFMLGRAFFVYWPAGYRPLDRAPSIVPDFGDMRLIH